MKPLGAEHRPDRAETGVEVIAQLEPNTAAHRIYGLFVKCELHAVRPRRPITTVDLGEAINRHAIVGQPDVGVEHYAAAIKRTPERERCRQGVTVRRRGHDSLLIDNPRIGLIGVIREINKIPGHVERLRTVARQQREVDIILRREIVEKRAIDAVRLNLAAIHDWRIDARNGRVLHVDFIAVVTKREAPNLVAVAAIDADGEPVLGVVETVLLAGESGRLARVSLA